MPKPGRVLVIDDEVDMLENCARLLTCFGYEVGDISLNLQAKLLRVLCRPFAIAREISS